MQNDEKGKTQHYNKRSLRELEVKNVLVEVYRSLSEKGYDPINQISGYIMTGDPTYITNYNGARSLITKIDRNELMNILIQSYLEHKTI